MDKESWKIMIVDDEKDVHMVTKFVLKKFTFKEKPLKLISAYSAKEAKELMEENPDTTILLLDVVMEEEDSGLKVVDYVRRELNNHLTRIILRTGQPGQAPESEVIIKYDINEYKEKTELTSKKLCNSLVTALRSYIALEDLDLKRREVTEVLNENVKLNEELKSSQDQIIFMFGEIAEMRSLEVGQHVQRVSEYSKLLAEKHGLSLEESELVRLASPLHDIGKIGIPDAILNKPGKLTKEEFEIMKTHSQIGHDMLKRFNRPIMNVAKIIALQHHEKYNGKGYPQGLSGENIHIFGRITAIADVFDALGCDRVYKKAWELDKIIEFFKQEKGEHFDPVLVDILLDNIDEVIKIKNK